METSDKTYKWRKKLGLSNDMDIKVLHRYSHIREELLGTTYNALSVKLPGTMKFWDGGARSKVKRKCGKKEDVYKSITSGRKDFC